MVEIPSHLVEVPCALCRRSEYRVKFRSPWTRYPQQLEHFCATTDHYGNYGRIVTCNFCGLVYTNPRPAEQELLDSYNRVEDREYLEEDASRSINAYLSLNTIKQFVRKGKLLDVGCSTGYFLNAARLDFDVHGVEPSHWAAQFAKERLKLDILTGTLEEARFPAQHFDVVCMSDVIEHLAGPLTSLQEIHRVTKTGGLLYLVTPDIDSPTARILRSKWWGLRPAHLYYFSAKTLRALLDKAGFDVIMEKSYGRVFSCGYWLSRLKNYPRWIQTSARWFIQRFQISNKVVYINTMDSLE
ncbi:MAG: class I SAM-dependent methyltransferase, partial [Elusimicrobia bacterium]|nr:class I SAM-dependent methyltransferase [Elusimicrobiota bacterium]